MGLRLGVLPLTCSGCGGGEGMTYFLFGWGRWGLIFGLIVVVKGSVCLFFTDSKDSFPNQDIRSIQLNFTQTGI